MKLGLVWSRFWAPVQNNVRISYHIVEMVMNLTILIILFLFLYFLLFDDSGESGSGKTHTSQSLLRQLYRQAGGGIESQAFKVCSTFPPK